MSHPTFSNIVFIELDQVSYFYLIDQTCVWSASLSSLLVAIKTMRVPRQYWEKKERRQSQSKVIPYFPSFLFKKKSWWHETKSRTFMKLQFYTQWTSFKEGCFFFSCGQFDQWSTSWFCRSLLVLWGLQVKPPCSPERTKQNKSHAQELAK